MNHPIEPISNSQGPASSEPAGLRYAVLWHTGGEVNEPHFDLMIETRPGSDLATWRCPVWPIDRSMEVTRLRDHRRIYLSYEGELSDHRGSVQRMADGVCQLRIRDDGVWVVTPETGNAIELAAVGGELWNARPLE